MRADRFVTGEMITPEFWEYIKEIVEQQKELGQDFDKILQDNLWDMLVEDDNEIQ